MFLFSVALASGAAPGTPPPADEQPPAMTLVGPSYRRTSPVLTEGFATPLASRDWADVVTALRANDEHLDVSARKEAAFLEAWALVRLDRAEKAVPLLERFSGILTVPEPYVNLVADWIADGAE